MFSPLLFIVSLFVLALANPILNHQNQATGLMKHHSFHTQSQSSGDMSESFDPLLATALDLQAYMKNGSTTASELVERYLQQIEKHDDYLKAMIQTAPGATKRAAKVDEERSRGCVRGPLHGIPFLIKDNIDTGPGLGMSTSSGSLALLESESYRAAPVIDKLIEAGAVILGKSSLTELSSYKASDMRPGWSAVRGQCRSPYIEGDIDWSEGLAGHSAPGGSSTGSAVGVAAGYAPIALGTDTIGSIITPSSKAALYAIRITPGRVSMEGIAPISKRIDALGVMAKTHIDLQNTLHVLLGPQVPLHVNGEDTKPWPDLKIGVVPEWWKFPAVMIKPNPDTEAQIEKETRTAYMVIKSAAASFQEVDMISPSTIEEPGVLGFWDLLKADFRDDFNSYLEGFNISKVRSVTELIEFNNLHVSQELPGDSKQDILEDANAYNLGEERKNELFLAIQKICRENGIDKVLEENDLDAIMGPADSTFNLLVSGGGYPSATMPLSTLSPYGRPFGVFAIARRNDEATLLRVMQAWEKTFPSRKLPIHLQPKA